MENDRRKKYKSKVKSLLLAILSGALIGAFVELIVGFFEGTTEEFIGFLVCAVLIISIYCYLRILRSNDELHTKIDELEKKLDVLKSLDNNEKTD